MVTPKANRAYHAIVRRLERLTDVERADVWQRLASAYESHKHVVVVDDLVRKVSTDELVAMVAEGLNRADRRQGRAR